ncbi:hypothetical protein N8870_05395 [Alphaproteobacteria bacterium]|nr:hypothetical protein [Alphaproteobacteria bacterium]
MAKNYIKKAFVSGIGVMGRRHVVGLINSGYYVEIFDLNLSNFSLVKEELKKLNLNNEKVLKVKKPSGKYHLAFFSETADVRLDNFENFLKTAEAERYLLEKPLTSNPKKLNRYIEIANKNNILEKIFVNLGQRNWKHINTISEYCLNESEIVMTINCGAMGLGCIGVHYIDNFLFISNDYTAKVSWAKILNKKIESPRGKSFIDYGANFVLEGSKSTLFMSMSSESSSHLLMTLRGKNFKAYLDYTQMKFLLLKRDNKSKLPLTRYGAEYKLILDEKLILDPLEKMTEKWVKKQIKLPSLLSAMHSHKLVFDILKFGGEPEPYRFT